MAENVYGYRSGPRIPRAVPIDASTPTAPAVGDMLKLGTAGYWQVCAANEEAQCVAMQACSIPGSDGAQTILADFSSLSIYEYPADTGSVVAADLGKIMDCGGAQSINRDASATGRGGDGIFQCVGVDTVKNTVFVRLAFPVAAGA
jgi:hypothetical protein